MSKWKCGICGSEFENYYAQGFDDIIYCPLCYFKEIYKREQKKTKLLQNQLQQKENIIKEVREYITKQVHRNQQFYEMDIENILEILDKDVTKKSDCNYEKAEKENK